jgi:FkbH-like protein
MELKTDQFNLTTRRYTEEQLRQLMARPDVVCLTFRLRDRFADHDLVSSLLGVIDGETLRIDSWLMSCRVFSRTAEHFIVNELARLAARRRVGRVVGEYRPTEKNRVVADLFPRLGFRPEVEGGSTWSRAVEAEPLKTFVVRPRGPSDNKPD